LYADVVSDPEDPIFHSPYGSLQKIKYRQIAKLCEVDHQGGGITRTYRLARLTRCNAMNVYQLPKYNLVCANIIVMWQVQVYLDMNMHIPLPLPHPGHPRYILFRKGYAAINILNGKETKVVDNVELAIWLLSNAQ
jgi:hypothetical protein